MHALVDELVKRDRRLFRRLAGWRSTPLPEIRPRPPGPVERGIAVLSWSANTSKLWLAIAAALFGLGGRTGKRAAVRGLGSIGATSAVVNFVLKPLVKRERPSLRRLTSARRLIRRPTSTSFPSGHAASAAAFTAGVALERPRTAAAIAPVAATVAYSRTYLGVHYPLDVAAGAALGCGIGLATRAAWPALAADAPDAADEAVPRLRLEPRPGGEGVTIVVNPSSGGGADVARPTAAELRELLPDASVIELGSGDDPAAAADAAGRADVVGVCGGDGTLAAAAQVAFETRKPLLVFPGGTMNHLAHDLGITSAADAARALAAGDAVEIDVATLGDEVFLNSASFGAHTELVDRRRTLEPRIGRWPAQLVAALRTVWSADPVEVEIDGRPRRIWMAFIGNGRYHDAGLAPGWRHALSGGELDVRVLDADGSSSRLAALLALIASSPRRSRGIRTARVGELTLAPRDGALRLSRDGETLDAQGPIRSRVHRRAIVAFAPSGSAAPPGGGRP